MLVELKARGCCGPSIVHAFTRQTCLAHCDRTGTSVIRKTLHVHVVLLRRADVHCMHWRMRCMAEVWPYPRAHVGRVMCACAEKSWSARPTCTNLARFGNHGSSRPGPTACASCVWNATQKHMAASHRVANLWPCSDPKHACHAFGALHAFGRTVRGKVNGQMGPKRFLIYSSASGRRGATLECCGEAPSLKAWGNFTCWSTYVSSFT